MLVFILIISFVRFVQPCLEYAMSEIPGIGFEILLSPVTWNFSAEPEKHCCGDSIDNVSLQH